MIPSECNRYVNESFQDYFIRICENKNIFGISWNDIATLMNMQNGESFGESAYRKKWKSFNEGREYERSHSNNDLTDQMRLLEKEKQKYFDARRDYAAEIRKSARLEQRLDDIESEINNQGNKTYPIHPVPFFNGSNDLIICISDVHLGIEFDNVFGLYNVEVARQRMCRYLYSVCEIQNTYNAENAVVLLLGDMISGNIHANISAMNRENVISQVKIVSDMISDFCYELTKKFVSVKLLSCNGNHSRISRKEDAIKDERLDAFIPWYISAKLNHIDNFSVLNEAPDSTIGTFVLRGNTYAFVHGDNDSFTKNGAANIVMMLGVKPTAIFCGHTHTCGLENFNNVKFIRSGSLCGSGDDFTIQKRLIGNPSQMCCVCNSNGIYSLYPIELE